MKSIVFFLYAIAALTITSCKGKVTVLTSDEDVYRALKEPLIATIINKGKTLRGAGPDAQVFEFSFKGYMTNLPYRVTLSRNAQFEDCAGCIGDWQEGMLSSITYDTSFISLRQFIVQMVHSNEPITAGKKTADMAWSTKGCTWRLSPTDETDVYYVEATEENRMPMKKWGVFVKIP